MQSIKQAFTEVKKDITDTRSSLLCISESLSDLQKEISSLRDEKETEQEVIEEIDEEQEAKADLHRKYDVIGEAENQENFCN